MYIDTLNDLVNKCNNTYHSTIKMKPLDENSSTYIDLGIENNKKPPKFEAGEHVRISRYKNIFPKSYAPKLE